MSADFTLPSIDESLPWGEVGVLYRRVCLLRACGRGVEADRLQSTELTQAIDRIRQAESADPACDAKLAGRFALEAERVANATVLAEILRPLLNPTIALADAAPADPLSRPRPARTNRPPPARSALPGIADFIDEMIQQEQRPGAGAPAT